MTDNIITLPVKEAPLVQTDAIATLQASLGVESGRDVVERAVFEISDRLCRLELALHDEDWKTVGKTAAGLVCMSTQIGLLVFAEVASALANTIANQDDVAATALAWRLLRVGEASLFCAVEQADRSG